MYKCNSDFTFLLYHLAHTLQGSRAQRALSRSCRNGEREQCHERDAAQFHPFKHHQHHEPFVGEPRLLGFRAVAIHPAASRRPGFRRRHRLDRVPRGRVQRDELPDAAPE